MTKNEKPVHIKTWAEHEEEMRKEMQREADELDVFTFTYQTILETKGQEEANNYLASYMLKFKQTLRGNGK